MSNEASVCGNDAVGYKRPPRATRFCKGQSGNPRGRPRNRHRDLPYNTVLGQMVTIREDGRSRRVTAAEAFLLQLTRQGLDGDTAAARASLAAIETTRASDTSDPSLPTGFCVEFIASRLGPLLCRIGMAVKQHAHNEQQVRLKLRPWIVEAALARIGSRTVSEGEQREVWHATQTPHKVNWPDWWTYHG